jgi:hypothetical protein
VEKRCRASWRQKLAACRTKKAVYEIAAMYGTYNTFLSHHRKETLAELVANFSGKPGAGSGQARAGPPALGDQ